MNRREAIGTMIGACVAAVAGPIRVEYEIICADGKPFGIFGHKVIGEAETEADRRALLDLGGPGSRLRRLS